RWRGRGGHVDDSRSHRGASRAHAGARHVGNHRHGGWPRRGARDLPRRCPRRGRAHQAAPGRRGPRRPCRPGVKRLALLLALLLSLLATGVVAEARSAPRDMADRLLSAVLPGREPFDLAVRLRALSTATPLTA